MDDEGSDRFRYTKPYREVAAYLNTVKLLVSQGRYKISEREDKNLPFMRIYNLLGNRRRCAEMICSLEPEDFLHAVPSRMDGNEGQELFVFCRKHALYKIMANHPEEIWVYYKFDVIGDTFTVVVSFHEAQYEPTFLFR